MDRKEPAADFKLYLFNTYNYMIKTFSLTGENKQVFQV
jgi:hypothetical protein